MALREADPDNRDRLENAIAGADRMGELIEGILKYARLDPSGVDVEAVDVGDVVDSVRADLGSLIDGTDGTIHVEPMPTVRAAPSHVYQLFLNLVGNALKFHGDDPPTVEVRAERDGGVWRFEVEDDGVGIGPAEHDRIFEIFERSSTAGDAEGTGLGLSLCRKIVDRVGGDIGVESEAGEGATFWFTLPADDEDASEDAQASGMHAPVPP